MKNGFQLKKLKIIAFFANLMIYWTGIFNVYVIFFYVFHRCLRSLSQSGLCLSVCPNTDSVVSPCIVCLCMCDCPLLWIVNLSHYSTKDCTAEVALSVRAFASHAEGWVFESQPRWPYKRMLRVTVCVAR